MTFNELKDWLSDRLRLTGRASADINMRIDESPYERPVQLWKSGSDEFRNDFKRVVMDLVTEASTLPWAPADFHELGLLIEAADLWEAVKPLEAAAFSNRLVRQRHGLQLQMLTLRTLLALGWKGTPAFWLAQKEVIGTQWPSIVFEGLALHDLELAFKRLPELATNRDAMRSVVDLFPGLMCYQRIGISTLRDMSRRVAGQLHSESAAVIRDWFRLQDTPIEESIRRINPSLLRAIQSQLADESGPRAFSPMLCGSSRPDCAFA